MAKSDSKDYPWTDLSISKLEADIAYFDARLSLLDGDASSTHEEAQAKAYEALESELIGMLLKLRSKRLGHGDKSKKHKEESPPAEDD